MFAGNKISLFYLLGFPLYILVFVFIYWFSFWGFGGIGRKEVKSANLAEIGAFELGERKSKAPI